MGKETKIGLSIIAVLLIALGVVVAIRLQDDVRTERDQIAADQIKGTPPAEKAAANGSAVGGPGARLLTAGQASDDFWGERANQSPPSLSMTPPDSADPKSNYMPTPPLSATHSTHVDSSTRPAAAQDEMQRLYGSSAPRATLATELAPAPELNHSPASASPGSNSNLLALPPAPQAAPLNASTPGAANLGSPTGSSSSTISSSAPPANLAPTASQPNLYAPPMTQLNPPGAAAGTSSPSLPPSPASTTPPTSGRMALDATHSSSLSTSSPSAALPAYALPGQSPPGLTQPSVAPSQPAAQHAISIPQASRSSGQPTSPYSLPPASTSPAATAPAALPPAALSSSNPSRFGQPVGGTSAAPGGVRTAGARVYTVREGDTLFDIARYELGKASRWAEIYDLNRDKVGEDFDNLTPGMQLILPGQ